MGPEDISAIIFSLRDGEVWASWPDGRPSVMLGEHDALTAAMHDYIRQSEVAERLLRQAQAKRGSNARTSIRTAHGAHLQTAEV